MKTMKDDHNLYWKCDVSFLGDVFELENYGLFPSHSLSTQSLSSNTMLKMTKVAFQIILDPGMYTFFEKGTRVRK